MRRAASEKCASQRDRSSGMQRLATEEVIVPAPPIEPRIAVGVDPFHACPFPIRPPRPRPASWTRTPRGTCRFHRSSPSAYFNENRWAVLRRGSPQSAGLYVVPDTVCPRSAIISELRTREHGRVLALLLPRFAKTPRPEPVCPAGPGRTGPAPRASASTPSTESEALFPLRVACHARLPDARRADARYRAD